MTETDAEALPSEFAILEDGGELFLRLALDRLATSTFGLLPREVEQVGMEAQTGDDTNMAADGGEQFDGRTRPLRRDAAPAPDG